MVETLSTPEHRAKRLSNLRKLLGLSRRKLGEMAGVSPRNLENWEYARFHGLSEKGAEKIATAIRALGCDCNVEWLLKGLPPAPRINASENLSGIFIEIDSKIEPSDQIEKELAVLKQHHTNLISYRIEDNFMEPIFYKDDYLAGVAVSLAETSVFLSRPCIIQMADHAMLARRVMKGSSEGYFNLVATHTEEAPEPYIYNVKPLMIAPIIWLRRSL